MLRIQELQRYIPNFRENFTSTLISEARANYPSPKAGRKLNVHHPRRLLNVLFKFNLRPVSRGVAFICEMFYIANLLTHIGCPKFPNLT